MAEPNGGKQSSTTPGLDLLADITGTSRRSMNGDYSAISRALREYMSDIASTVGNSVSGEPQREASARERMEKWKKTLRKHGIKVSDKEDEGQTETDDPGQFNETSEASSRGQKPDAAKNEDGNTKSGKCLNQKPQASKDKGGHIDDTSSHDSAITALKEAEDRFKTQLHRVGKALQRLAKEGKARAEANRDNKSQ